MGGAREAQIGSALGPGDRREVFQSGNRKKRCARCSIARAHRCTLPSIDVAKTSRSDIDDVVLQRPEDLRVLLPVVHSASACAGAATAYLLRRIAYRAGAYAPGLQEHLFHELTTQRSGGSLEAVQSWFGARQGDLQQLGYRLLARRVTERTPTILDWVNEGKGFRGAMLRTNYRGLHPTSPDEISHAVGVTVDRLEATSPEELVMIDPWPGIGNGAGSRDRAKVPPALEPAHRQRDYHALIVFWSGWS
jgi:hypothetical protein